ncbi:MAG TPA: sigma-70 family RNA polymerase sigma factor [Pirellulaceae bacterium]|jgi:RNA polymerase sigma-70 factor (ECF subfamily)|nr:sigma-70 family RNA polymerase sigma factor [Pirellulaceae bacterium]
MTEEFGYDPAELIRTHQEGVWRYLRSLGCEASLAEDLTQETFLIVLQKPFQDYDPAATSSYLRTVGRNLWISYQRRAKRVVLTEQVEQLDRAWEEWAPNDGGEEAVEALKDCLKRLTDRARWALERRFRDKASRQEIAEGLGITEHGAKNLMQRAKTLLRECVETKLHDDRR